MGGGGGEGEEKGKRRGREGPLSIITRVLYVYSPYSGCLVKDLESWLS